MTLTRIYNVLAKLRSGEPLTTAERGTHDRGLVGVLRRLHDDLDRAFDAARKSLAFYAALPFYNRLLARSGFELEAKAAMGALFARSATLRRGAGAGRRVSSEILFGFRDLPMVFG